MSDYIEDFVEDESTASSDLFDCDYTPIDAVINQVTVFTGCTIRATENGDRLLIAYGEGKAKSAFFTDSKKLKNVFCAPNRRFPFRAVIKIVSYGNMCGFNVFSPNTEISDEDKENFEFYIRTKNRQNRRR